MANEPRKYFKTTVTVEILSADESVEDLTMEELAREIKDGDCSGMMVGAVVKELSKEEMAKELLEQGSDPEFLLGEDYVGEED